MLVKDMYNLYIYRFRLRNRFRAGLQKKGLQLIFFICLIKGYFVVNARKNSNHGIAGCGMGSDL